MTLRSAGATRFGAQAAIDSAGGAMTLAAGGALTMDSATFVRAGSGAVDIQAGSDLTLGKLRTSSSADLNITTGGALIDAGAGATDIVAPTARLVIQSVQGVATDGELDVQVRALDVRNTGSGSGAVNLRNLGALAIDRVVQSGYGAVAIETATEDAACRPCSNKPRFVDYITSSTSQCGGADAGVAVPVLRESSLYVSPGNLNANDCGWVCQEGFYTTGGTCQK